MAKKENNIKYIIGGVIIAILLIAIIVVYSSKPEEKEKLTEEDFKILDIYWDDSIYWDKLCAGDFGDFQTAGYKILTFQNEEELLCNLFINEKDFAHYDQNLGKTYSLFERDEPLHKGYDNIDASKNNIFKICCTSNIKDGEICDSVALPTKC
ncbi:MAG: hypothetical protein ABIA78_03980 [archaeon]